MKNFTRYFLTLFAFIGAMTAGAQSVTFTNESSLLGSVSGSSYEDCVVDVNIDGLDDVVRVTSSGLYIDYQQMDGTFDQFFFSTSWQNPPTWSLASGDLNNDGYRDFCFGNGSRVSFVMSSESGTVWTENAFPEYIFSQRSSMIDIDLDGDLDAYVCHDVDQSHMYYNEGDGTMTLDIPGSSHGMDFATHNGPGNYANMWVDYDNDGDTDFHLTKCRQGGSPGDVDVINQLYRNNGDGTFTEVGVETNSDDQEQSWTSVWEDFDHDGDFDIFSVNHTGQNNLQMNNGDGTFADNSIFTSGINAYSLGAWELDAHDLNNDGFVDIISEMGTALYYGNGDGTFTDGSIGFSSGGFGDLNNDGFLDCVRGNTLYMNQGNDNNSIKVDLTGIISNTDGIGARVEVYTPDGLMQIREVRSGRSFSPMSNLSANFGIGSNESIEQVIVKWPSGVITVIDNPEINQTINIPEADCIADDIEITSSGVTTICPGETVELTAPMGGASYAWSNGGDSNSVTVGESGVYNVAMYDADNCVSLSNNITVNVIEEEVPEISIQGDTFFCEGGSVVLTSSEAVGYNWSNGGEGQSVEIFESGEYFVTTTGICYDESSESIEVQVLDTELPQADNIEASEGDEITLSGTGNGVLTWYEDEDATTVLGTGDSFTVPGFNLDEQTSFWVTNTTIYAGELQDGGKEDLGGDNQWGLPSTGGYSIFNVVEDFTLLSATVYASGDGDRTFQLTDSDDNIIEEATYSLVDGENLVEFNWDIAVGTDWSIRSVTNDMYRNDEGVNYPYAIGDVGTIYTSNFGSNWYYYFYDWKIQKESFECESAPVEVVASIVGVEEINGINGVDVYPNPVSDNLTIAFNLNVGGTLNVEVLDAVGQVVISNTISSNGTANQLTELDVNSLASGLYSVRLTNQDSEVIRPFVKK